MISNSYKVNRHGWACPGHPRRPDTSLFQDHLCCGPTWITGTRPVMTII
jgi:hypothetical protein